MSRASHSRPSQPRFTTGFGIYGKEVRNQCGWEARHRDAAGVLNGLSTGATITNLTNNAGGTIQGLPRFQPSAVRKERRFPESLANAPYRPKAEVLEAAAHPKQRGDAIHATTRVAVVISNRVRLAQNAKMAQLS